MFILLQRNRRRLLQIGRWIVFIMILANSGCNRKNPVQPEPIGPIDWSRVNGPFVTNKPMAAIATTSNRDFWIRGQFLGFLKHEQNEKPWQYIMQKELGTPSPVHISILKHPSGDLYTGSSQGVFRLRNGSTSWENVNSGFTYPLTHIDSKGMIYSGSGLDGIYRSIDNGNSWESIGLKHPYYYIFSFVVSSSGEFFAGDLTWYGLFRSSDTGRTWNFINRGIPTNQIGMLPEVHKLAINSKSHVFAVTTRGLYVSRDNGNNWSGLLYPASSIFITSDDRIFVGSNNKLYRSIDDGASWTVLALPTIRAFFQDELGELWGISGQKYLFHSVDGEQWSQAEVTAPADIRILAKNPQGPMLAVSSGDGVFLSATNSDTGWSKLPHDFAQKNINVAAFSPAGDLFVATEDNLFRSKDNGKTWSPLGAFSGYFARVYSLAINQKGYLFVGTYSQGVFRSTDDGGTWTPLKESPEVSTQLRSGTMIIDAEGNLYIGHHGGSVIKSSDDGNRWLQISNNIPPQASIWSLAVNSKGRVFAGTQSGAQIFRSLAREPEKTPWKKVFSGLAGITILDIAIDEEDHIYFCTNEGPASVYRSTDLGETWTKSNEGLSEKVNTLFIDAKGALYAGTAQGLFKGARD